MQFVNTDKLSHTETTQQKPNWLFPFANTDRKKNHTNRKQMTPPPKKKRKQALGYIRTSDTFLQFRWDKTRRSAGVPPPPPCTCAHLGLEAEEPHLSSSPRHMYRTPCSQDGPCPDGEICVQSIRLRDLFGLRWVRVLVFLFLLGPFVFRYHARKSVRGALFFQLWVYD